MLINNRYQVIKTLGEGGFGHAYLAEDTQMPSGRRCVIKQLKPLQVNSEIYQVVQERFQREAAILEKLGENHPQIPRLYAYFSENQKFYLVQEWIEGITLEAILAEQGPQPETMVRSLLISLLPVLNFIHAQGLIHRDLKPDNIILRSGHTAATSPEHHQPVLIDFGAVRETMGTVMNSHNSLTSSIVIGTPGYMPSEQAAGRPIPSSDLYSLGLTAIYALTGRSPQDLVSDPQTGEIIWRQFAGHVSPELVEIMDKAVRSHPRDRYSSAQQMLTALSGSSSNGPAPHAIPSNTPSSLKTVAAIPAQPGVSTYQQSLQNTQQQGIKAGANNTLNHSTSDHSMSDHSDRAQAVIPQKRSRSPGRSPVVMGLIAAAVGISAIGGGMLVSRSAGDSSLQASVSASSAREPSTNNNSQKQNGDDQASETGTSKSSASKLSVTSQSSVDDDGVRTAKTTASVSRDAQPSQTTNSQTKNSQTATPTAQLESAVTPDNPDEPTFGQSLRFRQDLNVDRVNVYAEPGDTGNPLHYGLPGDRVTLRDQVNLESGIWNLVRFESGAEGWVAEGILAWPDQAPPVAAASQNSAGQLPQYGWLSGAAPGSQVDVYPAPLLDPGPEHYGLVGDLVTLLDSAKGYDDGLTWYRIEFESGAVGWVRNDFIELP